jgi:hypothetical protein
MIDENNKTDVESVVIPMKCVVTVHCDCNFHQIVQKCQPFSTWSLFEIKKVQVLSLLLQTLLIIHLVSVVLFQHCRLGFDNRSLYTVQTRFHLR